MRIRCTPFVRCSLGSKSHPGVNPKRDPRVNDCTAIDRSLWCWGEGGAEAQARHILDGLAFPASEFKVSSNDINYSTNNSPTLLHYQPHNLTTFRCYAITSIDNTSVRVVLPCYVTYSTHGFSEDGHIRESRRYSNVNDPVCKSVSITY